MRLSRLMILVTASAIALAGCKPKLDPDSVQVPAAATPATVTVSTSDTASTTTATADKPDDEANTVVRICQDGTVVYKYLKDGRYYIDGTDKWEYLDSSTSPQSVCS